MATIPEFFLRNIIFIICLLVRGILLRLFTRAAAADLADEVVEEEDDTKHNKGHTEDNNENSKDYFLT